MKFKKEVQKQFQNAGWYEGRNLQKKYDKIKYFNELPELLKEFLYEYGDLMVETNDPTNTFIGTLNLKEISKKRIHIKSYFKKPSLEGNVLTFPIGFYKNSDDCGTLECDKNGTIYLMGEFPIKFKTTFKEGIQKIIQEDHSGFIEWNYKDKTWMEEY